MSFSDYLIHGFSIDNSKYDIRSKANAEKKQDKEICKKIASIWDKFAEKSAILMGSSTFLGGLGLAAVGLVMISNPITAPMAIAAAVAVTAYVAWTVFIAVRTGQANFEASAWNNASVAPEQKPSPKDLSEEVVGLETQKQQKKEPIRVTKEQNLKKTAISYSQTSQRNTALKSPQVLSQEQESKRDEKDVLFYRIANNYYATGNYSKAIDVAKEISSYGSLKDEKEAMFYRIANDYYATGNYNKAVVVAKEISSYGSLKDEKEALFYRIANDYYVIGNYNKAVEVAKEISSYGSLKDEKEVLFYRIANNYYSTGNYNKAVEVAKEISSCGSLKDEKEARFFRIANNYYVTGNYKKAIEVAKEISSNGSLKDEKEALFKRIANIYYDIGDYNNAIEVAQEIR